MTGKWRLLEWLSRFVIVYFAEATKLVESCIYEQEQCLGDLQVHALAFDVYAKHGLK